MRLTLDLGKLARNSALRLNLASFRPFRRFNSALWLMVVVVLGTLVEALLIIIGFFSFARFKGLTNLSKFTRFMSPHYTLCLEPV